MRDLSISSGSFFGMLNFCVCLMIFEMLFDVLPVGQDLAG